MEFNQTNNNRGDVSNVLGPPAIVITEVKVTPVADARKRLLAWVTFTLNGCIGIRSCRIVQGKGRVFLSFPQEPGTVKCPACNAKPKVNNGWQECCHNPIIAKFCMHCGEKLPPFPPDSRAWHDLVLPYDAKTREVIESAVLKEYERVKEGEPAKVFGEGVVM